MKRLHTSKGSPLRGGFKEVTTKRSLRRSHFEKVKGTSEKRGKSKVAFIVTGSLVGFKLAMYNYGQYSLLVKKETW